MEKNKKLKVRDLFKKVKLLILDVDGVLTKGEIIYDDRGRELKIFNVKDGLGIFLLSKLGIKTILFSAKASPVLKKRASDMRASEVIAGILPKERMLDPIKSRYKVSAEEIGFIGDDLLDLGLLEKVGLGIAVNDAPLAIKRAADYVTSKNGGEGAVREVVNLIIQYKGLAKKVKAIIKDPRGD